MNPVTRKRYRTALKTVMAVVVPALAYFIVASAPLGIEMHPLLGSFYVSVILYCLLFGIAGGVLALWVGGCLIRAMLVPDGAIGGVVLLLVLAAAGPLGYWWLRRT